MKNPSRNSHSIAFNIAAPILVQVEPQNDNYYERVDNFGGCFFIVFHPGNHFCVSFAVVSGSRRTNSYLLEQ